MSRTADIPSPNSDQEPLNVYLALTAGILSVSIGSILIRLAQADQMPSILIAASRVFLAALVLTPITLRRHSAILRGLKRSDLALALISGIFLAIHFAAWVTSLEYTSVLLSTVIVTSSPIWVALLEFVFLRSRLPRLVIIGLIVAIAGGLLISFAGESTATSSSQNDLLGAGLSLVGAIAVAVYLIIGRRLGRELPLLPYIWLVYGFAGLILMLGVLFTSTPVTGYPSSAYLWLIGLTIFPQLIGHTSFNYAVKFLPATIVSMVTQLEPIGSSILAYFIFTELPRPLQIIGSAVVLFGIMLANYGQAQKRKPLLAE